MRPHTDRQREEERSEREKPKAGLHSNETLERGQETLKDIKRGPLSRSLRMKRVAIKKTRDNLFQTRVIVVGCLHGKTSTLWLEIFGMSLRSPPERE